MNNSNYSVDILIGGKPITKYPHNGDIFIEGRPDSEYTIKITNNNSMRIKAVVAVDGLSVLDGKAADEKSSGYVINGWGSITIEGWRVSSNDVNAFVFGNKRSSYSAKTGQGTSNTGVIGVMIFEEDVQTINTTIIHQWNPYYQPFGYQKGPYYQWNNSIVGSAAVNSIDMANSADTTPVRSALGNTRRVAYDSYNTLEKSVGNLGTGFGESIESKTTEISFKARSYTAATIVIYYDDKRGLEARGIIVDPRKGKPNAFPGISANFCKPV